MRKILRVLGLLAMTAASVCAQQTQQPDKDGVYVPFRDVKHPKLVNAVAAVLPPEVSLAGGKHVCTLSMVIGADGIPTNIEVVNSQKSRLDDAAIAAVKQSQFEPGSLDGKPVPVRAVVWVPFVDADHPATPETGPPKEVKNMTVPRPLKYGEAEFSDEARRKHFSGTVVLAFMVTEDGLPVNVHVVSPLGMGLDEQAIKAASQYRFKPATLEGIPVPFPSVVIVSFRFRDSY
jgi:TonB family protein